MKREAKLEVWRSRAGIHLWRWRLRGANGKVMCQGEGHLTKAKAVRAAQRVAEVFASLPGEWGMRRTKGDDVPHGAKIVVERKA